MSDRKKSWRNKAREYLAIAFGGKCTVCGYDKLISALDYHHLDPKNKDDHISKGMRNGYAWSRIVEEARKCTLICCRCHRELHAGLISLPENYVKFNEEYADIIRLKQIEYDNCPVCNNEKRKRMGHCSLKCAAKQRSFSQRRFHVSVEDLTKQINEKSFEEIGRSFGVSGNAIKKRCKRLGIYLPKRKEGIL